MNSIKPINYRVTLEPDLDKFRFFGIVEILIESVGEASEIVLNILELAIWKCQIFIADDLRDCAFFIDPERELLKIIFPKPMSGSIRLRIEYDGIINNKMAGFYRSSYVRDSKTRYIAVTQFEESDARRAFPCMDHPLKKATFDIEIITDEHLTAISNTDIESEQSLGNSKKRVKFRTTPKMSTYLVFFCIGEFEFKTDSGDARVRAAALPGLADYTLFAADFGGKSLQFCERYYDIPYPLPKMDMIAVPDFAFGAMENWGAITFRENLLLKYPGITARAGEGRICEIIAHEIVHQWFGNLVSPSDWKYLWLNESFATYLAYHIVDHYKPEWEYWSHFLQGQTEGAFARDALHHTIPIEITGGEHVVINSSTAPIIYNKGGSILRQIEGYIGSDRFREGLRRYLKNYQYDCAASHHLWEVFEAVSESGITDMMQNWIGQPGFPLVEASRKGSKLILKQRRFTYLPNKADQQWIIPVIVDVFGAGLVSRVKLLMKDQISEINLGTDAAAFKVNAGQSGFYRVRYMPEELEKLGKLVSDQTLCPEDRWGLQNDLYALVKSGDASLDSYLNFLKYYADETAFLPLTSISCNLYHAFLVIDYARREKIAGIGKNFIEKLINRIGLEPSDNEPHTVSVLRDQVLWQGLIYGSEQIRAFGAERFTAMMQGNPVHPDIAKSIMQIGATSGDNKVLEWFIKSLETSDSEYERMNILTAIACFGSEDQIRKSCDYTLKNVPDRNKFVPIAAMAGNPAAIPMIWDWYVENVSELEKMHPMLYERVIAAIVPVCGIEHAETVKEFFRIYVDKNPKFKDIIRISLERMDIYLRMRDAVVN